MAQRVDTADASQSAQMDIGQFDPPLTDTAQGALCIPGVRSALLEGTRPPGAAGTQRLRPVAAGLTAPGTAKPGPASAPLLGLWPLDVVPSGAPPPWG